MTQNSVANLIETTRNTIDGHHFNTTLWNTIILWTSILWLSSRILVKSNIFSFSFYFEYNIV